MTSLSIFKFHNNQINTLTNNNEIWFLANDICKILDFKNPRTAVANHCKPWGVLKQDTPTSSGIQSMAYINEPNLYRLIVKSRKPEAEEFERKVFEEILPTIRRTGSYSLTINTEQKYLIKKAVNERAYRTGEHHQTIYHKLYDQFKINSYEALPVSKFNEAIDFLGGINVRSGLSDDDWYKMARLFVITDKMHNRICDITPALEAIFSKYADSFHSMSFHFKRELNEAKSIIERETAHIQPKGIMDDWNRVLPVIRHDKNNSKHLTV